MDRFNDERDYAAMAREASRARVAGFDRLPDAALVDARYLATLLDHGLSTIWRKTATDPRFPKRIKVSQGCTRFAVGDIRRYLSELMTHGDAQRPSCEVRRRVGMHVDSLQKSER